MTRTRQVSLASLEAELATLRNRMPARAARREMVDRLTQLATDRPVEFLGLLGELIDDGAQVEILDQSNPREDGSE